VVNKFTRDSLKMSTDTADETNRLPDDFGVAGRAAAHVGPDGEREPAVIRGSRRIEHEGGESVRVLLDLEGQEELLDTDRDRVEVLA